MANPGGIFPPNLLFLVVAMKTSKKRIPSKSHKNAIAINIKKNPSITNVPKMLQQLEDKESDVQFKTRKKI